MLILTTLFAQEHKSSTNPRVYSALGDTIYNNLSGIQSLKNISSYEKFSLEIDKYANEVKKTKKFGYEIESGEKEELKLDYLSKLRELSKKNDFYVRSAHENLDNSIKNADNDLFVGIVNSGLIDVKQNKAKILNYYKANSADIEPEGILENILNKENIAKQNNRYHSKQSRLDKEKIERIRRLDAAKQKELERKLEKELKLKKKKIREEQERELIN